MRNPECPAKAKTRKECWRNCPVANLYKHREPVIALQAARKMACLPQGIELARKIGTA